jgi:hypothetical protein
MYVMAMEPRIERQPDGAVGVTGTTGWICFCLRRTRI